MKTVSVVAVIALCICVNTLPAKTANVKMRCRSGPGVITITKENHIRDCGNCDESTYYRIDGMSAHNRTQNNYLIQQQKGNPRTLDVVKKSLVNKLCDAERIAHQVVSDYHFKDKWYSVKNGKDEEFIKAVKKAVQDMETFLMFTAMINSYEEAKHGAEKDEQLFHFA